MKLLKHQMNQNSYYMKLVGLFMLASVIFYVLQDRGVLANCLIRIVFTGIVILLTMLMTTVFLDPEWDWKLACCIKNGKFLEDKYPDTLSTHVFHRYDELQIDARREAFESRFGSFALVLIFTTAASIFLSMKLELWFRISLGIFSTVLLVAAGFFFHWRIKKNFQGCIENQQND